MFFSTWFHAAVALPVALVLSLHPSPPAQATASDLEQLLRQKKYVDLERALASTSQLSNSDRMLFEGVLANHRNRVSESIRQLEPLIPALSAKNKELAGLALSTLADDYEKSFRYSDAADVYVQLQQKFRAYMTESEQQRVSKEAVRWGLLRRAPRQTAVIDGPFTISSTRDRVGLQEVTVQVGKESVRMILDTGANLSAISRSLAKRLGLKLSAAQAATRGGSEQTVPVHTAIIPELRFGRAKFRNVAVLVLEDKDLTVAELNYHIPGSIGFPVLSALGKITFFADGRFAVAPAQKEPTSLASNMFLDRLTPVVEAEAGGAPRLFTIDTGATGSYLSAQYYREHTADFESQSPGAFDLLGSGGSLTVPAYFLSSFTLQLGGACARLKNLPVLIRSTGTPEDAFYGNLGQSAVAGLESYTFDFRRMTFTAKGSSCGESGGPAHGRPAP